MQTRNHFSSFVSALLSSQRRWRIAMTTLALSAVAMPALAACPSQPGRFVPNDAEVTDSQTGLVWARCSVGQSWDGSTCSGIAGRYTHEQALEYAASLNGWRLPSVKELISLVDKGCINPAIDASVFPNTVNYLYWAATPYAGHPAFAWSVRFNFGGTYAYGNYRSSRHELRLVRASQ